MSLVKSIRKRILRKKAKKYKHGVLNKYINLIFPELKVRNGPFKGMRYPSATSVGSTLFPKLLGSYELELSEVVEEICNKKYSAIVDVGCAEGYYAVGLSRRIPDAHVYAYDINEKARNLCTEMFEKNSIDKGNYSIGQFCSKDTFSEIDLGKHALIVCDCEGYEKELFVEKNIGVFKGHDLLIETHDCFDINITKYLENLFRDSHSIKILESIDDIQKVKKYNFPELNGVSLEEKYILLGERRSSIMEWYYMESKSEKLV